MKHLATRFQFWKSATPCNFAGPTFKTQRSAILITSWKVQAQGNYYQQKVIGKVNYFRGLVSRFKSERNFENPNWF